MTCIALHYQDGQTAVDIFKYFQVSDFCIMCKSRNHIKRNCHCPSRNFITKNNYNNNDNDCKYLWWSFIAPF